MNKFKIVVASYNNENWVEYNLASILNQTYDNYHVYYVDDCSTDRTSELVNKIVGDNEKFSIIRNDTNIGANGDAIYNYLRFIKDFDDQDIYVAMCGDDWLIDDDVLKNINNFYNSKNVWMTYGEFYAFDGSDNVVKANPQNTPYPDFVHKHKLYRRDVWRASHLLTMRGFLAKAVDHSDIKSSINNKWYYHAPDLAFAYPCLEMCPKDKIGVVDFPTYVWNSSPQCQIRTKERESVDNQKFEIEIRNKKHYTEGLSGNKLPQIRVFGDYRERNSIPSLYTYTYEPIYSEYDITLLSDKAILDYIDGKITNDKSKKIVAEVVEPAHLMFGDFTKVYDSVYTNYNLFDRILTCDDKLLQLPNSVFMNAGAEVVLNKRVGDNVFLTLADESLINIYSDKTKLISAISSNKVMSEGHIFRIKCLQYLYDTSSKKVDYYGQTIHSQYLRNILKDIDGKIDALKDYMFSIAIENGVCNNYFTEKILDCFLTGTIPIYHGCPNIGEFFDTRGIIIFNTQEELTEIVDSLTINDYSSRLEFVRDNFNRALSYKRNNDDFFTKYIKDLL